MVKQGPTPLPKGQGEGGDPRTGKARERLDAATVRGDRNAMAAGLDASIAETRSWLQTCKKKKTREQLVRELLAHRERFVRHVKSVTQRRAALAEQLEAELASCTKLEAKSALAFTERRSGDHAPSAAPGPATAAGEGEGDAGPSSHARAAGRPPGGSSRA